jgi:hypothetical protein
VGLLRPLTPGAGEDGDLAAAGQRGRRPPAGHLAAGQLQHLLAQLSRLYDEFADAIASGSEFRCAGRAPASSGR